MKENCLVFDTETTGLPPKGAKYDLNYMDFPYVVQFAWFLNGVYKNYLIKPNGWVIPEEATAIHGVTTEMALEKGVPFHIVVDEFIHDCSISEKIIAHNIYFDSSVIKANVMRMRMINYYQDVVEPAMDKTKRVDTMYKTIKFVDAKHKDGRGGKWPKLEELYMKLFDETFPAHDANEDVKALVRCVEKLHELQIIEL
ncbi:MAG: 3'-5' exonuclease [Bacteroidetes bacterium]|nr:3'-5' exonuclease [Bacteroidota bacterium]